MSGRSEGPGERRRMPAGVRGALRAGTFLVGGVAVVVALLLMFANGTHDPVVRDGAASAPLACSVMAAGAPLPAGVPETSGLARGIANPGVFWTHNDSGGDPELFGVAGDGALVARVRVDGASAHDWEDIEAGPCRSGGGACLYIADTGDNEAERDHVTIYQVPEPGAGQTTVPATPIHVRYPDGPRDAEGLFIVDGDLHVVTKGREGPIRVYRVPDASGSAVVPLTPLAELAPRPGTSADYVTAATASPDGRWVATRTYRTLTLFEAAPLLAGTAGELHHFNLTVLREMQGEGLVLDDAGGVWLSSEARGDVPPSWRRLDCALPAMPGE